MSNGQWARGNGQWPASQPASGKSGGQGVDFQLSGRACRRGRSANGVGKRMSKPLSATPEATRNRPEIDSKSTPNRPRAPPGRPGGPRARFRTHSRVPGPSPRLTGRLRGVPKSASENAVVSPGGVSGRSRERLGRVGNTRRAPRGQFSARLATQEARSGGPERFWYDFRSISDRFSDCLSSSFDAAVGVVA